MAQGKKTDSKTIADLVANKLSNPDASYRDLAKDTNISHVAVGDILKQEAPGLLTTSNKATELFDVNVEIIKTASEKVLIAMKEMKPEYIKDAKTMQDIVETAFKQNQLIKGGATERIEIQELDDSRKAIIANRFKNG